MSKEQKKQAQDSERIRNCIEGKFGQAKRRFSLSRVMAKLSHTSVTALTSNKMSSLITTNNLLRRQINQQRLDILFFGSPYCDCYHFFSDESVYSSVAVV